MRILVTGSSGFIGKRLVRTAAQCGHSVFGLDLRHPGQDADLRFIRCDLLDPAGLTDAIKSSKPEAIVHLAARTDLDEKQSLNGYAANIQGVRNLIEAIRLTPAVRRCIFTSSQLVCKIGYLPRNELDYCPDTLYGESKVQTETIVRNADGGNVEWCLVRPTTIWGPGMSSHYQRLFRLISSGRYFHVGTRPLFKSYGYVGNTAHQYLALLTCPAEDMHRNTLYLADYEPISLQEWTSLFQKALTASTIGTCPESVARLLALAGDSINRLGFRRFPFNSFRLKNILTQYKFDLSETERICGPLPYTLVQGVAETVDWLKAEGVVP